MTTVSAIKFRHQDMTRAERRAIYLSAVIEAQGDWITEQHIQANYNSNKFEWDFVDEESAVLFKLTFGL